MKYTWNTRKMAKMLEKDEIKLDKKYSKELQLEINALRLILNKPILNVLEPKDNTSISRITYKAANYVLCCGKKQLDVYKEFDLSEREIVSHAVKTMSHNDSKCFHKIARKGFFDMEAGRSETYYFPCHNISAICVKNRGMLSDSRNIMHEVGHAKLFAGLNYDEIENIVTSFFNETVSILNEMFFIDRLDKHIDILNEQSIFLNNYYERYRKDAYKIDDSYAQSFVLAEYLFMLYKKDRAKFDNDYHMFIDLIKKECDKEIINRLNITNTDILAANEKYINLYRK